MKICGYHWQLMQDSIKGHGIWELVSTDEQDAANRLAARMSDPKALDSLEGFDPLMEMNMHFSNEAVRCGGIEYMMQPMPDGRTKCPVCELGAHAEGFNPPVEISAMAEALREHASNCGMVPRAS